MTEHRKQWISCLLFIVVILLDWAVLYRGPIETQTKTQKEQIISKALETPEGREALAQAMIDTLEREDK